MIEYLTPAEFNALIDESKALAPRLYDYIRANASKPTVALLAMAAVMKQIAATPPGISDEILARLMTEGSEALILARLRIKHGGA